MLPGYATVVKTFRSIYTTTGLKTRQTAVTTEILLSALTSRSYCFLPCHLLTIIRKSVQLSLQFPVCCVSNDFCEMFTRGEKILNLSRKQNNLPQGKCNKLLDIE